jgi:hypothetical protein
LHPLLNQLAQVLVLAAEPGSDKTSPDMNINYNYQTYVQDHRRPEAPED